MLFWQSVFAMPTEHEVRNAEIDSGWSLDHDGGAPCVPQSNVLHRNSSAISVANPGRRFGIALSNRTLKPGWYSPTGRAMNLFPPISSKPFSAISNAEYSRSVLPAPIVTHVDTIF
jgi:hypothetical protein